jgi:hypothetical protein
MSLENRCRFSHALKKRALGSGRRGDLVLAPRRNELFLNSDLLLDLVIVPRKVCERRRPSPGRRGDRYLELAPDRGLLNS